MIGRTTAKAPVQPEEPASATGAGTLTHIQAKIERLRQGASLRVLDLFSGCGGLSLGFCAAGLEILAGVEVDPWAAKSHAANFFRHAPPGVQGPHARARDITKIEPEQLASELRLDTPLQRCIDLIIGGPPCQAFARVGRAKLREVAEHPRAFKQDPRANLYLRFLHYVEKFQPLAIVMENVPDVINYGGHNIPEETCEVLEQRGDIARYTLLNSAFYGVPQMRERMFLIALVRDLQAEVNFPSPTHWIKLPKGYESSRQVALKNLQLHLPEADVYYIQPPKATSDLRKAVTAEQALSDLPPITGHLTGTIKRGTRRLDGRADYPVGVPISSFAKEMRLWKGFKAGGGLRDHVIRCTPRDYPLFREMRPGDQYPQAHRLALSMLDRKLRHLRANGAPIDATSPQVRRLAEEIVPPYDPSKFPNKWRKMEPNLPARTLMAHLGKDTYSHIHYDDSQARMISVREAARLQSFPDGFMFCGTMNPAFRQIGNAVPPLLARAVARAIKRQILAAPSLRTSGGYRTARPVREERRSD
jgi:DNA (cytosine-5)-methyltransferase 1